MNKNIAQTKYSSDNCSCYGHQSVAWSQLSPLLITNFDLSSFQLILIVVKIKENNQRGAVRRPKIELKRQVHCWFGFIKPTAVISATSARFLMVDLLLGPNQHQTCLIQMSQVRKPVGVKGVCLGHLELGFWQTHLPLCPVEVCESHLG